MFVPLINLFKKGPLLQAGATRSHVDREPLADAAMLLRQPFALSSLRIAVRQATFSADNVRLALDGTRSSLPVG